MHIDIGAHRLFYKRTGPGAWSYMISGRALLEGGTVYPRVAVGEVTSLRGKPDAIRAHLARIGREALGIRGEPCTRRRDPGLDDIAGRAREDLARFRQRRAVDRPARAFGDDTSSRSEIKRATARPHRRGPGKPTTTIRDWSTRKDRR